MRRGRWLRRFAREPSIAGTVAVESVPYETPRRFSISRNLVARQPGVPVSSGYLAPVAPPDVRASGITLPVAPPDEFRVSGDSLRPVPPPVVPSRADVPFAPSGGAGASEDHLDAVAVPAVTAGADLPYAPPDAFGVSPDHFPPVVAPEVDASGLALPFTPPDAFAISANHLPPIAPRIDGVFFHRDRKMGQASRPRTERSGVRRPRIAPPSPFLALLPILLPPAPDTTDSPFAFPHPLYEFQGKGVEWLLEHDAALLADDMGLGKTVQAIATLRHKFRNGAMRALVVCPKSVQSSWARHFREWAPELEAITIAGAPYERRHQWRALHNYRAHVGMITYASLRIDVALAQEAAYDALVLDEIQNVKNPVTQQSRAVRSLESTARWGLSGTPLENDVEDLATILRTLGPGLLPAKGASTNEVRGQARRVMIRRRKEDVLEDLPPIRSAIEYLDLTDRQRRAYEQAEEEGVARLRDGTTVTIPGILALITRLKQICNGVDGHSAKLDWLKDYLGIVVDEGDKALVFSQYVDTLRAIEPEIRHFSPLSYTGSLTDRARDKVVSAFQEDDARHHALLMSLKAGGTGLTLTAASRVVHFDSWWNPAVMEQAAARAHRIGQKKAVFVTTLVTEDTIEERIQKILDGKRELFKAMVDDLSTEGVARALTEEELYGLFDMKPPSQRRKADTHASGSARDGLTVGGSGVGRSAGGSGDVNPPSRSAKYYSVMPHVTRELQTAREIATRAGCSVQDANAALIIAYVRREVRRERVSGNALAWCLADSDVPDIGDRIGESRISRSALQSPSDLPDVDEPLDVRLTTAALDLVRERGLIPEEVLARPSVRAAASGDGTVRYVTHKSLRSILDGA